MPITLDPYFRDDKGKKIAGVDLRDPRLGFPARAQAAAAAAGARADAKERVAKVVPLPPGAAHSVDLVAIRKKIDTILKTYTLPPRKQDRLAAQKRLKQLQAREQGETSIKVKRRPAQTTSGSKRGKKSKKGGMSQSKVMLVDEPIPAEIRDYPDDRVALEIDKQLKILKLGKGRLKYDFIKLWNGYICIFFKERDNKLDNKKQKELNPAPFKKYIIDTDLDGEQRATTTWDIYCQIDAFLQEACYKVTKGDGTAPALAPAPASAQAGGPPPKPIAMSDHNAAAAPAFDVKPDHKVADAPQPQGGATEPTEVLQNLKRISIGSQGYEYLSAEEFELTGVDEIKRNSGLFNRGWEGVFRQFTIFAGRPICSDAALIPPGLAYLFNLDASVGRTVSLEMHDGFVAQKMPLKGPAAVVDLPAIWIPNRLFDCFYDEDDLPYAVEMEGESVRRRDYPDPTIRGNADSCCYRVVNGKLQTLLYKALSDASGGGGGGMRSDSPDEALYYWTGNEEVGLALGLEGDRYRRKGDVPVGWEQAETATPKAKTPMRTATTRDDDDSALMDSEIRYWKKFPNPVMRKWKNEPKATIPVRDRGADDLFVHQSDYAGLIYTKKRKGDWREVLGPKKAVPIGSQIGKRASAGAVMDAALRAIGGMDPAQHTTGGAVRYFDLASATDFARRTIGDPLASRAWAGFSKHVVLWDAAPAADDATEDAAGGAAPIELDLTKLKPAADKPTGAQPNTPGPASMDTSNKPGVAPAPAAGGGASARDAAGAAAKDGDLKMHGVGDDAMPRRKPAPPSATEIARASLRTEQEWCHLVGHGDGGDEVFENFISGSKHCNTEQLAIETGQRTARRTYGQAGDAVVDPILLAVKVTAYLFPNYGIGATRRAFLASEVELLRVLGLLVQQSPYHPPDVKATSKEIETLLDNYEIYKATRQGPVQPVASTTATAPVTTAAIADPFEALLKKASAADVKLAKGSDETPAATWLQLWQRADGAPSGAAAAAAADLSEKQARARAAPAGRADEKRAAAAAAMAPMSGNFGAAGIAAAPADDVDEVGTDEKVTFKKQKTDNGTAVSAASGAAGSSGSEKSDEIIWNRVSEDLKERLGAILALPLPLGNFVRYKVFFNRRSAAAKGDEWVKVFDHTFDAQKESFDFFQYKIVETTVRRVIATAAGKEDSYRAEIKAKADGKKPSGAQAKEAPTTAAAAANPAARTVAMDSRN